MKSDGKDLPIYHCQRVHHSVQRLVQLARILVAWFVCTNSTRLKWLIYQTRRIQRRIKMMLNAENILQKLTFHTVSLLSLYWRYGLQRCEDLRLGSLDSSTKYHREISSVSTQKISSSSCPNPLPWWSWWQVNPSYLERFWLAVGRTVAAILENYQNEDGSVTIPEALSLHGWSWSHQTIKIRFIWLDLFRNQIK